MASANGEAHKLRQNLDACIIHFQNEHTKCSSESRCRQPNYVPSFNVVRSQIAVRLLTDFVHNHVIYKNARDYVYVRDTGYIESANNSALIYLDKRIHYGSEMYETRENLWILDWNEHVDREITSRSSQMSAQNERMNLGKKRHKRKTYTFVDKIWDLWTSVHRL